MKTLLPFLAVLLLASHALQAQTITVGTPQRDVGSGRLVETSTSMEMLVNASMNGEMREMPFSAAEHSARTETVLAVENDTVRELRVVISRFSATDKTPAGDRAEGEQPVIDRSYLVHYADSGVTFSAEDGDTLSLAESSALKRLYGSGAGFDQGFAGLISGRSFTVGVSVPQEPSLGNALFQRMHGQVRDLLVFLQELRVEDDRQIGVFGVSMIMAGEEGPSLFELNLDAQVTVDIERCAPVAVHISGHVVLLPNNPDLPMQGHGDFSATLKAEYTP